LVGFVEFLRLIILPALDREKATLGIKEDQNFASYNNGFVAERAQAL
jgi:hypothetical protein